MHCLLKDSIAAIVTPTGVGGVCIIRVSGNNAFQILESLLPIEQQGFRQKSGGIFFITPILNPVTHIQIDIVVCLLFKSPKSYTGEDTFEIQGHGGSINSKALLEAVISGGARLAEPGEFTKRAFLNGKIDLSQAEAICDLIMAKTECAANYARMQLKGVSGKKINKLYEDFVKISAQIEYFLDFDEYEIDDSFISKECKKLQKSIFSLDNLLKEFQKGSLLRQGVSIVISGKPNAGKSSLFNAFLGYDRAIVHDKPGTTRDVIEEEFELDGVACYLADTAGLRSTAENIEGQGIMRAENMIKQADINLHVIDGSVEDTNSKLIENQRFNLQTTVIVRSKSDLPQLNSLQSLKCYKICDVSVVKEDGLCELKKVLSNIIAENLISENVNIQLSRSVEEIKKALQEFKNAVKNLNSQNQDLVLAASHLKAGSEALGRITGRIYSNDLLDRIFSNFCVGK